MTHYLDYVNLKLGTDSCRRFGSGNTQPLVAVPYGMSNWAIQTSSERGSWYYHPHDRSFEGFRLTHMACNWLGDYGQMIFMPQTGEPMHAADRRWSSFRPQNVILRPDYMRVNALRYRYTAELTPTARCAVMRVRFRERTDIPRFAVIPFDAACEVRVEGNRIYALTRQQDWHSCENFAMYCVAEFDCSVLEGSSVLTTDTGCRNGTNGTGCGINVALGSSEFTVRIGTSFLSYEQALVNLERETAGGFEQVREAASRAWEEKLSCIEAEDTYERLCTLYSNLHRFFLFPSRFYETDAQGKDMHYCPHDGSVRPGKMYVNNGFWDTARTVYPLLSLLDTAFVAEAAEGFVQIYRDSGWLPKWPSPGETGLMPGTYIDAVIADAAEKDLLPEEVLRTAYEGMLHHATTEDPARRYGRHGTADYNRLGYLPYDKYRECTNHTLDYVYGDFCISVVAEKLGDSSRADFYRKRSQNYKKLFDPKVGFIHAKDSDGQFKPKFNPIEWGGEYCEGGAYQNAFAVYHDIEGLAGCYGGTAELCKKLDELFARSPDFDAGEYRYELHEMSEMAAVDFGQCAISNQPSFHLPYLYACLGQLEKTQYWTTKIVNELFTSDDDGYPGDEDTGTMAAWYIFTCLGFYPICPGKAEFTVGKAQLRRAVVHLANKNTLTVTSDGECPEMHICLNGKKIKNKIFYRELMEGGTLSFSRRESK